MIRAKNPNRILCIGIMLCVLSAVSKAQAPPPYGPCADSVTFQTYHCAFEECTDSVTVGTTDGSSQYYVSCQSVPCCKQLFSDCSLGDDCFDIRLKDPKTRKRIAESAGTRRILMADCRGHYALYEPRSGSHHELPSVALDERILR